MSESEEGFRLPATRQNEGMFGMPRPPPGGVNVPAGTSSASVTVAWGIASFASESQVAAEIGSAAHSAQNRRMGSPPLFARHQDARGVKALPHDPVVQDFETHGADQIGHPLLHLPAPERWRDLAEHLVHRIEDRRILPD